MIIDVNHCILFVICNQVCFELLPSKLVHPIAFFPLLSACCVYMLFTVDEAAAIAIHGVYLNAGQCCCAASRTYVHEDIYDAFIAKCKEIATKRVVGDPFAQNTEQGPQV